MNHKSKIFVDSHQSSLFADFLDDKQQWDSRPRWTPLRRGYYYCSRGGNFHLLHWLLPWQLTLTYPTGSKWLYLYINAHICNNYHLYDSYGWTSQVKQIKWSLIIILKPMREFADWEFKMFNRIKFVCKILMIRSFSVALSWILTFLILSSINLSSNHMKFLQRRKTFPAMLATSVIYFHCSFHIFDITTGWFYVQWQFFTDWNSGALVKRIDIDPLIHNNFDYATF